MNRESIINMTNADSDPEGSTFVSQTFSALHLNILEAVSNQRLVPVVILHSMHLGQLANLAAHHHFEALRT